VGGVLLHVGAQITQMSYGTVTAERIAANAILASAKELDAGGRIN
jgi:hypothetical protein